MAEQDEIVKTSLLRSKEIDEIIGRPPHWLIQWGISLFFIILILVFSLSYFIRYPETINSTFSISTSTPAIPIKVNSQGELTKIRVTEGLAVHKNDTLFSWKRSSFEKSHWVISPSNGTIVFTQPLYDNLLFKEGQVLFYLEPLNSGYHAWLFANKDQLLKLKIGQKVTMDLDVYPNADFGYLHGSINYISDIKTPNGYYVKIKLNQGMRSGINKTILLKNDLSGHATIMIENKRLINKFIRGAFN